MPRISKIISDLDEGLQEEILASLKEAGPAPTARRFHERVGRKEKSLYTALLRTKKNLGWGSTKLPGEPVQGELSKEDKILLASYKEGKVTFERVQRELSAKMVERILRGDANVKVSDWLRSETVKMKKEESERQRDAMEVFIDNLFSGNIPSVICPNCGQVTSIKLEEINEFTPTKPREPTAI
jgi:hypothetical protein